MGDCSSYPEARIFLELCYNLARVKNKEELIESMKNLPMDHLKLKRLAITFSPPWGEEETHTVTTHGNPSLETTPESQEEWTFDIKTEDTIIGKLKIFPMEGKREVGVEKEFWNKVSGIIGESMMRIWREKELRREVKAREEELEETVKKLKRNREIQTIFMKRVAHELRTPLHSIIGFSQILLEEERENLLPNTFRSLSLIMEKAKEMTETIDDITLLWEMRKKEKEIEPQEVDLPRYLEDILETLSNTILEKGLRIIKEIKVSQATWDREKMARVIYHLISNALKFTPSGGEIRIKAFPTPGGLGLSVCDTGIGIPPQHMEEIWEPFKQLEDPLTRRYQGMGVGLSLVKEIVEAHGGEVWAERGKDGRGTCFTMIIPQPPKKTGGNHG